MNHWTGWLCLFPTLIVGVGCSLFGCVFILSLPAVAKGWTPDQSTKEFLGCSLWSGIFGVAVLIALGVVWFVTK